MKRVLLVGIGAGDPDQITVQAMKAINRADLFFVLDKGDRAHDLLRIRRELLERYATERPYRIVEVADPERDRTMAAYREAVDDWHERRAAIFRELIGELEDHECAAVLVWGDPSLYDSTLRVIERAAGPTPSFEWEVVPGITSIQALAAKHRIPITEIAGTTRITTGRNLATEAGPRVDEAVIVMLDGKLAFRNLPVDGLEIYWGANLGTEYEALEAGPIADVADAIEVARRRVKDGAGWVMDTYLIRRRSH